ncbi:peptidoglycan DD-metalloendopeptidase family protein [Microbulbifer sp. ZKSA002]|uniref:peptidoglycan DD-metalloendopeptidase family protein n=1 Tax=Microbulbifer sp. ZKSA002 TaxID=3243388 RepID=UPI0040398FD7
MKKIKLLLIFTTIFLSTDLLAQIYKYKDENGSWVFSDKKPTHTSKIEKIKTPSSHHRKVKPKVYISSENDSFNLIAKNPYFAPIQIKLTLHEHGITFHKTVPARSKSVVFKNVDPNAKYRYWWVLGDPEASAETVAYQAPVASKQEFKITQSFNGRFSHSHQPNQYAIDIAMPIGTYIGAARAGTVILVKDDYHMGGKNRYFLDKANYIQVLHEDGTYAGYYHILMGSALVKPGDRVNPGDKLAMSGSSGYSTGPHLHFALFKNKGFARESIPFLLHNGDGKAFSPKSGIYISNQTYKK